MSSSWSRLDPARFSTTTPRPIPRRNGPCSSPGKRCRAAIPTASSSMIGTASSRRRWTKALPIWGYGFCQRRCEPQRRTPYANDWAAAFVGNVLDVLIPFHQRHLPMTIRDWAIHYHRGRPHSALGPGLPEPMSDQVPSNQHRHSLPIGYQVVKRSVLGGLHHEYGLKKEAA